MRVNSYTSENELYSFCLYEGTSKQEALSDFAKRQAEWILC